jgi:hypothetical protein
MFTLLGRKIPCVLGCWQKEVCPNRPVRKDDDEDEDEVQEMIMENGHMMA